MGSDPAPIMEKLFFYYYERKWFLQTKKRDLQEARISSNVFRFVDDLSTFSNFEF